MNLGLKQIAVYLPEKRISNLKLKNNFNFDDDFTNNKIGVKERAIKEKNEKSSDLCVKAFKNLIKKEIIDTKAIDCCIVVTQNPDYKIPHTSSIVHNKIELSDNCACFDISLGCSGYVYGLSNIISFMKFNNLKNGLLFTADPYSDIIDINDRNTAPIFGDAATVSYISENSKILLKDAIFGTSGKNFQDLICKDYLYMNGRSIFNFTATMIPQHIKKLLIKNNLEDFDIDKYIFHQGSKYIVDIICKRLKINKFKVPFDMLNYGNTVSSSIPIILEKEMKNDRLKKCVISGFGVGLSWGSAILQFHQ